MQATALPGASDWDDNLFRTSADSPRNAILLSHQELFDSMSRNTWRLFEHFQACGFDVEPGTRQRVDSASWARLADCFFFDCDGHRIEVLHELSIHRAGTVMSLVSLFRPEGVGPDGNPVARDLLSVSMHEAGSLDWAAARFGVTHYNRRQLLEQLSALSLFEEEGCLPASRMVEISQALEH